MPLRDEISTVPSVTKKVAFKTSDEIYNYPNFFNLYVIINYFVVVFYISEVKIIVVLTS